MTEWQTERIHGQESFRLKTKLVELALTQIGGHLAPVTFFPGEPNPITPYAIAPWAEEVPAPGTPRVITVLRGDWFCSAFGVNAEPCEGRQLPLHGETANSRWGAIARGKSNAGCWLRLGMDLPLQGGSCEATTALLSGQSVVYQRHDLRGLSGPVNPGHHATLAFPNIEGAGRLSFSRVLYSQTYLQQTERPEHGGYSWLRADTEIKDLRAVPCIDGSTTDLYRYPVRRGFEDIVILCSDPTSAFAWSAVTFREQGFVWFSLRDPKQLASTLLWFSNGGRYYEPWNGRHVNVLGIEDMTGFFHVGLAASCRSNPLSERGIRTCLEPNAEGDLSISYIQGVARIPSEFDAVAAIQPQENGEGVLMHSESGVTVELPCEIGFLNDGLLGAMDVR